MPMYLLEAILEGDFNQVLIVVAIFSALYFTIHFIGVFYSAYEKIATEKMNLAVVNEFLDKAKDLDLSYFDDTTSFDKYNRAFGNCCAVIGTLNSAVSNFVTSVFNIVMIVGLLVWMDLYMFIAIFFVILINVLINKKMKKIDYERSVLLSEKSKQVNYLYRLFYIPQLIREIKINTLSDYVFKVKNGFDKDILALNKKQALIKTPFNALLGSLNILEKSLVALYFGFAVVIQRIVISEYFTYVNAYNQLKNTIAGLSSIYTQLYGNSLFASDYIEFINSKENITSNVDGKELEDVFTIEFVGVSFKYPNNNKLTLNKVSFKITKGDKIAIIGKNGAGKTTIIKLLLRLYDPSSGDILINGVNIKEYNTKSLRGTIQTLFQDFAIFAFSIRDNIVLGKDIPQRDVLDALKKIGLKEKIEHLPLSTDTPITSQLYPGGVELSGGESQKLSISRIYASKPKTFIMDEPTSSLDPHSEYALYNDLMDDTQQSSTIIVISHRLTLTYKMSKIIVIDSGAIAEQGTHNELIKLKGIYFDMYSIQAAKYTS